MIVEHPTKIEQWPSDTRDGYALFSRDMKRRYHLARPLTERALLVDRNAQHEAGVNHDDIDREAPRWMCARELTRVVFVMLNPSTADAFKLDPTVTKCRKFAERWGADVLEVVNLFAHRSTYPEDLKMLEAGKRGDDEENDRAIAAACTMPGVQRVIAAWGNHGALGRRAEHVTAMLVGAGVQLSALGTTEDGKTPLHPLARGKRWIPIEREPRAWPWLA